jgi:hypothetical protein
MVTHFTSNWTAEGRAFVYCEFVSVGWVAAFVFLVVAAVCKVGFVDKDILAPGGH